MAPIVADGASVAYAKNEEDVQQLDGKLVVAWLENQPVVRWFQHCGRFALLRAENPSTVPQQVLVDLEDPKQRPRFRRVLWVQYAPLIASELDSRDRDGPAAREPLLTAGFRQGWPTSSGTPRNRGAPGSCRRRSARCGPGPRSP